jgi:hypothetical protein
MHKLLKSSLFAAVVAASGLVAVGPLHAVTAVVQPHSIVLDQATQAGNIVQHVRRGFRGGGRSFSRGGFRGGRSMYWRRGGINRGWRGGRWAGRPGWRGGRWAGRRGWGAVGWRRGWGYRRGWGWGGYGYSGYWGGGACGYGWRWSFRWGRCVPVGGVVFGFGGY